MYYQAGASEDDGGRRPSDPTLTCTSTVTLRCCVVLCGVVCRKKAKELNRHPALVGVRRVKLSSTRSAFWR